MHGLIEALAWSEAGVTAVAAGVGAWAWWQVRPSRAFWILARTAQAVVAVLAIAAGIGAAAGHEPDDGLFWVYALVPIVLGFIAEQLRLASAQTVLDARGIEHTAEIAAMPDVEQRAIVLAILRREMGVIVLTMIATCFLALRAIGTAAGF